MRAAYLGSALRTDHLAVLLLGELRAVVHQEAARAGELVGALRQNANAQGLIGEVSAGQLDRLSEFSLVEIDHRGRLFRTPRLELFDALFGEFVVGLAWGVVIGCHVALLRTARILSHGRVICESARVQCLRNAASRNNLPVALYAIGDLEPTIDPTAFVHPDAVIIGNVTIGPESSVWPSAVLRGDSNAITVGARTSIQDGAIIHTTRASATVIGSDVVVGHVAHMEGCLIEDGALIGSGSIVLPRARIGRGALVAAGAVVPNDVVVPALALARGVPAKIVEGAAPQDVIADSVATYRHNAAWYNASLRRLD